MCSSTWDMPDPSHLPSLMLPVMDQACTETTGALWSSRTMIVSPFSRWVIFTPAGSAGISTELPVPFNVENGLLIIYSITRWQYCLDMAVREDARRRCLKPEGCVRPVSQASVTFGSG